MIDDYLNYLLNVKGKSQGTINEYRIDLNIFYSFITKDIEEVTISDLHAFIGYLTNERNNSNKTKARRISCLKSYFKYLKQMNIINNNPTVELETPKQEKRLPIYLSLEEAKKLLDSAKDNKRDYCILTLFLNCGLRLSELVNIDIEKIKDDTLTIIGKGDKERTVYLNNACLNAIKEYRQIRDSKETALFLSNRKTKFSSKGIQHLIEKYLVKSGLSGKGYSPHKLRHTAATLMYQNGADILSIKEILGHESVATTQIYTHINQSQLRNAVERNPLNV